ncbi:MAG: phosphatase PAP2 family protein [Pseudomonadota bacterium]
MATGQLIAQPGFARLQMRGPERLVAGLTLFVAALCIVQILLRGVAIDWLAYGGLALVFGAFVLAGHYYRASGRSERIGLALMCTGVFGMFSPVMVVFNYLLMPTTAPAIDGWLLQIDAMMGFHWPDYIAWAAANPWINGTLKLAYMSTIPQMAAAIIILGLCGRQKDLHLLIVSVAITSVMVIVFWGFFPSHGAKAYFSLPEAIELAANPIVTTQYGRELLALAGDGPGLIAPSEVKGLIAFPSYHIVLAFTAAWAMRNVRYAFSIYVFVNALIIPATPMHGGHHLVDVPAGIAVFLIGVWLARRVVAPLYHDGTPEVLPAEKAG